jgi:dimethylargininase
MATYGCTTMTAPLRRVLVRRPSAPACALWREYGWRAEPDPARLLTEHDAFCALLESGGAEVVVAEPLDFDPDAVYTYDPGLVTEHGAILLRPGKTGRRSEPAAAVHALELAGVPVAGTVEEPAIAEGGDFIRLDERMLLAGRGYRTTTEGIRQVGELLPGVETAVFDLPNWRGEGEVMHLLSLLSPLDVDLAVAYLPLVPVSLIQLLAERDVEIIAVPEDDFPTMGANVLALAPRVALALDGNSETRVRLERAGVEVLVYQGEELSLKGDGGPTCLTMPLLRA